jgi:two-component system CheB/CheR fusion protein
VPIPAVGGKGPVGFPVIGVCASAGGWEAVKDFFSGMAEELDPDSAIILVQEQAPRQQSLLGEWIQPCTRMTVVEAVEGIAILRDHVYVATGGREISLRGGLLHVSDSAGPSGQRLPSDFLLGSLAAELGPEAIGIILTGCAGGAAGARAIKKAGGQVIVQSPGSAGANRLPPGAIGAGLADHELEPAEMPAFCWNFSVRTCKTQPLATTPPFKAS